MKKIFILLIIFLLNSSSNAVENVSIDNADIHEYKGQLGKWVLVNSKKSMLSYSKKFSTPLKDIYKINAIKKKRITRSYYFIPFSEDYQKKPTNKRAVIKSSADQFIWPINDVIRITSVLGFRNHKFHPGLDIPAPRGKPIIASMEGYVSYSGYSGGYGRSIVLRHRNNFYTRYSHNTVNLVKKGDFVKKGQIIGLIGSTGNSTGNHVHFEIRCKDIPLDPLDFLPQQTDLHVVHTLKNWK